MKTSLHGLKTPGRGDLDRWAILLVFMAQAIMFPFFPALHSANELSRLYLVEAMVDRGEVAIDRSISLHGGIGDKSRRDGRFYSDKPPGTAFLAAPGVALRRLVGASPDLAGDLRIARFFAGILPTLLLLLLLRREMIGLGVSEASRALAIATYGLGTLAFPYSVLFYGHQLTAVLLYAVWFCLRDRPVRPPMAAVAGFLGAACFAVEYQSAVYLAPLVILFLARARPLPAGLAAGIAGAVIPLAALAMYHHAAFGSPWKTGYSFVANPFFAQVHEQGFMGVSWPRAAPFVGSLFLPSKGLFVWTPFLVLGFVGLVSFVRRVGARDGAFRTLMVALPLLFVSSMVYWDGGWTVGQRHLTPMIPFLVGPAALLLDRSPISRLLGPGLAAASVMMTGTATVVFPHLPENWANPFHDLTLPLLVDGCLARASLPWLELPEPGFVLTLAAAFLLLAVGVVTLWPDRMRLKVATVVLLVLIPLGWFDATSRLPGKDADRARVERVFFHNQCARAAGRPVP
jgi:hypothetical protein